MSPWKTAGFVIYILLYFFVLDVFYEWPAASLLSAFLKILPILHLALVVISSSADNEKGDRYKYRTWISIGLVFSAAGDAALVWRDSHFLAGTIMFGIAQLCYIKANGLRPLGSGPVAATFAVLVVALYFVVVHDLRDSMLMKCAIFCYMLLICTMTWRATASCLLTRKNSTRAAFIGAVIFVISDFMVAWDKFRGPFYLGPFWIMTTYYLAQYFIALSAAIS